MSNPSRRVEYESMSRGDLIQELCTRDKASNPELKSRNDQLLAKLDDLRDAHVRLQASKERYEDLFDKAPVPYCVLDREGVVVEANHALASLLCLSGYALAGQPFANVVATAARSTLAEHLERCFSDSRCVSNRLLLKGRGRRETLVEMVSHAVVADEAGTDLCLTVLSDLTHIQRSETLIHFLTSLNATMAISADRHAALSVIARTCVPLLADVCFIDLRETEDAPLRRVVTAGDGEVKPLLESHASEPSWQAYASRVIRESLQVFEPSSAATLGARLETELGARALALLPLIAGSQTLGIFGIMMTHSGRNFALSDFELARDVAHHTALALAPQ
jgi:PAS domain S-box-containing protein